MTDIATKPTTATATTATATTTNKMKKCVICLEDQTMLGETKLVQASVQCQNDCWVCVVCMKFYLIQCENNRQETASCPALACSNSMSAHVAELVLGRSYQAKKWETGPADLPDPQLLTWLRMNQAQQCGHCQAWIVHDEGCDSMQCLCGWSCQAPIRGATNRKEKDGEDEENICYCGWYPSDFYDNILRNEGREQVPKLATQDDLKDFANFYERRADGDCSDYESSSESSDNDEEESVESETEDCEVYIGSILDYEEDAVGVFEGTFLDEEEPGGGKCADLRFAPLFSLDLEEDDEVEEELLEDSKAENSVESLILREWSLSALTNVTTNWLESGNDKALLPTPLSRCKSAPVPLVTP